MTVLDSESVTTDGALEAIEECFEQGWTDGLPVVPPTEARVREFLDHSGFDPGEVIGRVPERALEFTMEHAAISAVMAGCRAEYLPVVVGAIEAINQPKFHFNHLASLASPWPLLVVNGPITKEIGMHSGMFLFGAGARANATIGRALSLFMWNYADARIDGLLRGQAGHPGRYSFCIAENEDSNWTALHVQEGFAPEQSAVTAMSTTGGGVAVRVTYRDPKQILDHLVYAVSHVSGDWGPYIIVIPPAIVATLAKAGWTKASATEYIDENAGMSLADYKRIGHWEWWEGFNDDADRFDISPEDETEFVHLFRNPDKYGIRVFPEQMKQRRGGVLLVTGGGDAGPFCYIANPYPITMNPSTVAIRG